MLPAPEEARLGQEPFSLRARAASFGHAFRGVAALLASQHNAWIHFAATAAVVALALWLRVSRLEWALLVLAMGLVWAAEALNTALEWVGDVAEPGRNALLGRAKDVAAAGVLLAAGAAALVGLLVLLPRLLARLASGLGA
jgi:diacylglycerol kinase (ATP)